MSESQLDDVFLKLEQDMNGIQRILSLPESNYAWNEASDSEAENSATEFSELFSAIDEIVVMTDREKSFQELQKLVESDAFVTVLAKYGLEGSFQASGAYGIQDGDVLLLKVRYPGDDSLVISAIFSYMEPLRIPLSVNNNDVVTENVEELLDQVVTKKTELERIARNVADELFEDGIRALRVEQRLTVDIPIITEDGIEIPLQKAGQDIDAIQITARNLDVKFLGQVYDSYQEFTENLPAIFELEIPTFRELETEKLQGVLLETLADEGVQSYLQQNGLIVGTQFRNADEFLFLDIQSAVTKQKVGALSINIYSNRVWLHDKDDVPIRALHLNELYSQAFVQTDEDVTVVLIAGSHEYLTDTMILAYCTANGIYLVSIPRDIYYQDRKLNTYFRDFGIESFQETIERLSGIDIQYVAVVDMYAFIEVVNTIGGIEVTLDIDLIDPTYRVKNGNIWSTLYYPRGTYQLNGIEALRIVRSRHTSNDFSRSERQKLVLDAIQTRLASMGLSTLLNSGDAFVRILSLVRSNLNAFDAITLARTYFSKPILGLTVLSTKNVLINTYTAYLAEDGTLLPEDQGMALAAEDSEGLEQTEETEQAEQVEARPILDTNILSTATSIEELALQQVEEPAESLGAWILLPKNNDWSLIRSFIRSEIEKTGV